MCTYLIIMWTQEFTTDVTYDNESLYMDMFDVDFSPLRNTTFVTKTKEIFSMTGFTVEMKRSPTPYYMNVFLPTALLTITSFIGFLIPADLVPGRMALLVTIFLMLVNISSTERERGPAVSSTGCFISLRTSVGLTLILAVPLTVQFCLGRLDFGRNG